MSSSLTTHAVLPMPRTIGDVEDTLLDAPTPAPVTRQPLRVVVGDNVPLDLPAPMLQDEDDAELASDEDSLPDVPAVRPDTPVAPIAVTPSISPDRRGMMGATEG